MRLIRSISRVDADVGDAHFTFAQHAPRDPVAARPFQIAQAIEMLTGLAAVPDPVLLLGDFNSEPGMNSYPLLDTQFNDAWDDARGGAPGFTCCQAGDLMNPESTAGRPHRPRALPWAVSRQRHGGHGAAIPPRAARRAGCGRRTTSAWSRTSSWCPERLPTGKTSGTIGVGVFTILLVEDDFDVREALAETLRDEGYAVECAVDGEQALDYLRDGGRPGLILLDLMMPRMSGSEFRMVQKVDPQLAICRSCCSARTARWKRRRARWRPTARSRKPIDLDELLSSNGRAASIRKAS